jgi:N-acetylneuraminic acid mutarotase
MRNGITIRSLAVAAAAALVALAAPARASTFTPGSPRSAHMAALLPDGDLLIVGGINGSGTYLTSGELMHAARDGSYDNSASMSVARASATATVMANGKVLVAGGITTGGTITNTAEVYNPQTDSWSNTSNNMTAAHYNHTATLLNNGKVLVCGGQTTGLAVTNVCDLYDPTTNTWSAAASMLLGRALHTATLLKDGKVWFAGGWNPSVSATNGWIPTTERYDPTANSFSSAHPLASARGLHTATMMGDGRIFVAGGYNGNNKFENRGILDTTEIYDPVSNTVIPGPTLASRREQHTATLLPGGDVSIFGGLGNITTSYFLLSVTPDDPFYIDIASSAAAGLTNGFVSDTSLAFKIAIQLGTKIDGQARDAEILFSSSNFTFADGGIYFAAADANNPAVGLRLNLDGASIGCDADVGCGVIQGSYPADNADQGKAFFNKIRSVSPTLDVSTGVISFNATNPGSFPPNEISSSVPNGTLISSGTWFRGTFKLTVPKEYIGATISTSVFTLASGSLVVASSYSVAFDGGYIYVPTTATVVDDGTGTNGLLSFDGVAFGLSGSFTWGADTDTARFDSGMTIPDAAKPPSVAALGDFTFIPSKVNIGGVGLVTDISTAIIRSMLFADEEIYNPKLNSASIVTPTPIPSARFGHTDTLLPNGDQFFTGGLACSNATCSGITDLNSGGVREDNSLFSTANNFAALKNDLGTPRYFHTATLLPDGTILIAGGSNGPNVLGTAEVFNPADETFTPTHSSMRDVRDLHTATLLPNGRVLIAGGFSTNATSTGSTSACELYFPDTHIFEPTTPMLNARSNFTATLMPDGNVVAVGGYGASDNLTATAEIYYSTSAVWSALPSMSTPRALHAAALLNDGRLMVIGGLGVSGALSTVEAYNFATNTWSALASLPHQLYAATATRLFDGRVLVVGGNDGFGEYNASYVYDPSANSWTQTNSAGAPLLQPRFGHTATLLPNDTVMISGGQTQFGPIPNQVEIYHINASSWAAGAYTFDKSARAFQTMTLAANGEVYAIGGTDGAIGGSGTKLLATPEKAYFTFDPDLNTPNAPPSVRQSSVTTASTFPQPNSNFTVTGRQFRGGTEASGGGAGSANSSFSFPHLVLQQFGGSGGGGSQSDAGLAVDLTTAIYANAANLTTEDTSLTVLLPPTTSQMPTGWYQARVGANDVYSDAKLVLAGPGRPTAAPASLSGLTLGISSVAWSWTALSGVDGYDVYQATSGVFLGTAPATGSPSFTQTDLRPNTTALVSVAGYTITGDGPLAISNTYYTLPAVPTAVSIASVSFDSLLLQWDVSTNTVGTIYEISESTDDFATSFSTPVPTILGIATNSVVIPSLQSNTTYFFRLRAFNTEQIPSDFSATVSTLTRAAATGLAGVAKSGDAHTIIWSWTDVKAQSYNVYNSTSGQLITNTAALQYNDTGLAINAPRSIRISAITLAGEGPLSASVTTYTNAATPVPLTPPLVLLSSADYTLQWSNNGNPNGTVYRLVTYELTGSVISSTVSTTGFTANVAAGFRSFGHSMLTNTLYKTFLYGVNGDGMDSVPVLLSTYTLAASPGFDPGNEARILGTTPVSLTLEWNSIINSTNTTYEVTYSTDSGFAGGVQTAISEAAAFHGSSTTISGLLTSTLYYVRVRAFNSSAVPTNYTTTVSTLTFNGGVASGSLGGTLTALGASQIEGNLGDGRYVLMRSPSNAFTSDVTVTISSYDASGGLCANGVNIAFQIEDSPALQPEFPVYMSIAYTDAELGGIAPSRAVLMRYVPGSSSCVPLETTVDTVNKRLTARLNHFSLYQIASVPLATSPSTARIFPNPYRVATDGYLTIDDVPPDSRVRIMTLRGETVLDQRANSSGLLTWSATNGAGRPVASGLYLVVVESGGEKKILKLAVIR